MTIADQTTVGQITEQRDAFAGRLFQSTLALFDVFSIYLGDHLGLYRAIADGGWLRSTELASRTASNERYIREWLEQQAVTGILEVDDATAEPQVRRYHLPAGHAEVLLDRTSLAYLSPMARFSGTLT